MKRMSAVGLCLVAVFAASAALAAVASATEPALYECGKAAKVGKEFTGHYTSKKCTEASKVETGGKYELREGIGKGKPFKGKSKIGANLEVVELGSITCSKGTSDEGVFTGPKAAGKIKVTFFNCETLGHKCENTATAGEVKTNPLKGEVGYINKAAHEVGVDLSAETGLYEAEFHCDELNVRVGGSVIGKLVSPINVFTKEATLSFEQSAGKQAIQNLEGMPKDTLFTQGCTGCEPGGSEKESGESDQITNKGEELELKA